MNNFGVTFTGTDISTGLTTFFAMGGVAAVLIAALSLRFVPKVLRALGSVVRKI